MIECSEMKSFSIQCVGDQITGADTGGTYIACEPSTNTIDPTTGCFESDDIECLLNSFGYVVTNTTCTPPCSDTTKVFYYKCCFDGEINCNE